MTPFGMEADVGERTKPAWLIVKPSPLKTAGPGRIKISEGRAPVPNDGKPPAASSRLRLPGGAAIAPGSASYPEEAGGSKGRFDR